MKCVCKCGEASPSLRSCGSLSPCDPLVVTDRQTQFRLAHQSTCSTSRSHCRRKYDAQNGKYTILPSVSKKRPARICHYLKHEEKHILSMLFNPVSMPYCTREQRQSPFCQSSGILVHFMVWKLLQNLLKSFDESKSCNHEPFECFICWLWSTSSV